MVWDDILFNNYLTFLLVLARVIGIFSFNPIFSRSNIPLMAKTGLSAALALIMASTMEPVDLPVDTAFQLALVFLKEAAVGAVLGFLVQMFMSMLIVAGEVIDTQIGLGMARIMDPGTGIQSSLYASFYSYLFILYFFAVNGHLSYIKLFALSYEVIPIGVDSLNLGLGYTIASFFSTILIYAIKFSMPVLVSQILIEISIGILMKTVPNIQVFVVNIQVKMLIGMALMFLLATPMAEFIDRYMTLMFDNLYAVLPQIAGGA